MKNLLFVLMMFTATLSAQTLTEAKSLFVEGNYEQALPAFERELKRKPKDGSLNYWYGACLYHTGKQNEALPYLISGEKNKIPMASLLLSEYHHNQYRFDKSLEHLDKFIAFGLTAHSDRVARMLKSIEKANKMLQTVEDVVFIDSLLVAKDSVLTNIKLHSVNGQVLPLRDFLPHKGDSCSIGYITERKDRIFYDDTVQGKAWDLFCLNRTMDDWEAIDLVNNLNQTGNERFPYVLNDGITIYFASDSYNSIGGYDLLVSRYNFANESFFSPEPLPMPFNSVYNDYMYIVDEYLNRGFLVSDRYAGKDSVVIYSFIPNERRTVLKATDKNEIIDRARLASIAMTQQGINMDSIKQILQERYQNDSFIDIQELEDTQSGELRFFVRDNLSYQNETDFQSDEAKQAYLQYLRMKARFKRISSQLQADRSQFTGEDNPEQQALRTRILNAERSLLFLERDLPIKEYEIRRLELNKIDP